MPQRLPPLALALVVAASMWGAARLWPPAQGRPHLPWLALAMAALGAVVCALGLVEFRRLHTTVNPTRPMQASALVTSGIYRVSRNPMYLGFLLMLVAWGVYLSHAPALLLGPTAWLLYMNHFQIVAEEQALAAKFGEEYRRYRDRVRRWL